MAKNNITQFDATDANNTDIKSIDISEGMSPANVNNALRALMATLKDMDTGATSLTSPSGTNITATTALKTPAIQFTDGDAAITIADGGGVTANNFSSTSVNIDGGAVDGITLGTNSAVTQAVIDNINIDGSTIGHTSDTDLMTVSSGLLTVAGEVSMTTLDIGGTNVTATAAELNILDGVTASTSELNILDGVTATTSELNIMDGVTATASEINIIDGDTSATSTTVADADRVVYNDAGTMKQVAVTDLDTYVSGTTKTLTNKTLTSPVINTSVSGSAILDEDNFASNSDTKLATQQSIKAYVDNVAGSTTAAQAAQAAAETAQAAAEAALDTFTDQFLGSKSSDPSTDNDGDALTDGDLYFNTTDNVMKVYDLGNTQWKQLTPTSSQQTNIDTVAGISSNVSTVAGISSNVTTVAGVSSNVTTVAGISSDVTTVAGANTNIGTVATNISNVNTVASNIGTINTKATVEEATSLAIALG